MFKKSKNEKDCRVCNIKYFCITQISCNCKDICKMLKIKKYIVNNPIIDVGLRKLKKERF